MPADSMQACALISVKLGINKDTSYIPEISDGTWLWTSSKPAVLGNPDFRMPC